MSLQNFSSSLQLLSLSLDSYRLQIFLSVLAVVCLLSGAFFYAFWKPNVSIDKTSKAGSFFKFFYASFLKPHSTVGVGQQAALESFYKAQADVYDITRKKLLRGREDMLGLVAGQLKHTSANGSWPSSKPVWVDIGGGTGYNIEAMQAYLDVSSFFSHIYLVDLSPSLCEIARKRFDRLGWQNVKIVCKDARSFNLIDYSRHTQTGKNAHKWAHGQPLETAATHKADLVTLSYSLSMIPDYHSVVDSITSLLSPKGIVGAVDFYVQSIVETSARTYTGGCMNRHVNWLSRVFWRAWFDTDRVGLEAARRDYLEYRFGTLKTVDERNYLLGGIPYYIFLGRQRGFVSSADSPDEAQDFIERLDAACTESPYLSPRQHRLEMVQAVENATPLELRSKAYRSAVVNLSSNLPLPSMFYQNNQRRIYYNDQLEKHTQFNNDYIYAFTWEDPRADERLLKLSHDDVVLCLTSAGDNLLDYLLQSSPRRIHAVDLNPNQNHLLELKIAAYQSLSYADFWKMFGEGKFPAFRDVLITKLSPHLSSQACQYWLNHASIFTSSTGHGLYETGGSGHAIRLIRWLLWTLGLGSEIRKLCSARTLNEQREIWPKIRRVLLNRALHWVLISTTWFSWKAAGVPPAQRSMIIADYLDQESLQPAGSQSSNTRGQAIWEYMVNTFDPVVRETLISDDNYFYLLCTQGKYSRRCHPRYLTPRAHAKLARPEAFENLRIHTDEIQEVISRIAPGTLTVAAIMDSMDWFTPGSDEATAQVKALNCALKLGVGRVMLRSASLRPWYIAVFESCGFSARRVACRLPGTCIDRVNMYASTWMLAKNEGLAPRPLMSSMGLQELEI